MTLPIHKRSRVRSFSSTSRPCRLVGPAAGKDHQDTRLASRIAILVFSANEPGSPVCSDGSQWGWLELRYSYGSSSRPTGTGWFYRHMHDHNMHMVMMLGVQAKLQAVRRHIYVNCILAAV
jgi:hypothetical protein